MTLPTFTGLTHTSALFNVSITVNSFSSAVIGLDHLATLDCCPVEGDDQIVPTIARNMESLRLVNDIIANILKGSSTLIPFTIVIIIVTRDFPKKLLGGNWSRPSGNTATDILTSRRKTLDLAEPKAISTKAKKPPRQSSKTSAAFRQV
jgi:hypothetical protein